MKVIGLVAVRDEEPFLPYFLPSILPVVDHLVALDDGSRDAGPDLLRDAGAEVIRARGGETFGGRRQELLSAGRRLGGTHFVVLDADEVFGSSLQSIGRGVITMLRPGEGFAIPFRTLWKGGSRYRRGREYDMPLCCIFRDDGLVHYDEAVIHEPRVPLGIRASDGALLPQGADIFHLQFVAWRRSQVKQAWYRCKEFLDGASPLRVNARYVSTLDSGLVRTRSVNEDQLALLPSLQPLSELAPSWHLGEVLSWFEAYGPGRFECLQIWHVPELRSRFEADEGRSPRVARLSPEIARAIGDVYGSARAGVRRLVRQN